MSEQIVLEVDALSFSWHNEGVVRPVLRAISFDLKSAQTLAITGPSGCGKTTLLRLITGLLQPSSGEIRYSLAEQRRPRIGFMFQDHKLVPWLTVRDNLTFGHASDRSNSTQFAQITDLLGLRDHLADYPAQLSGGLKERTALGRALLGEPDVLLLDEPLGSTDYVHRLEVEDYLFKRIRSDSIAALIVTHDLDQAVANANRIVVLPPAGSLLPHSILEVPEDLRRKSPSQARLAPQMGPLMQQLIANYEALL
jgi:ABC-type nitrate/sulfonate/bicarbonate transport system ATPase subunit